MSNQLPDYAQRLDALHRALADDFRDILGRLSLDPGATVLDAGCGDGFFSALLSERLPDGVVVALDSLPAYLEAARERLGVQIEAGRCRLAEGDVTALPFEDVSLDAVLSAHSMQSYDDIPAVLAEFRRVLKPGGLVAVLETDNVHSVLLSWPPGLELAVRQAEHGEIGDDDSYMGTYFPRFAPALFRQAGLAGLRRDYVFIQRQRPASKDLEEYVQLYLESLAESVGDDLARDAAKRLRACADPAADEFLPRQENFFYGSLQTLITARVPRVD